MTFHPGAWTQVNSNCTRSYALTYSRCSEYGIQAITQCVHWVVEAVKTCIKWALDSTVQCVQWAWQTAQQCMSWGQQTSRSCTDWADQTSRHCCTWWPCSWLCEIVTVIVTVVCVAWEIVVTAVCLVWGVVVTLVCAVFAVVVIVACALFGVIVTILCAVVAVLVLIVCLVWSLIEIIFCLSKANGGTMLLLTDGSVMIQECMSAFGVAWPTRRWWRLIPDQSGSYAAGSWSPTANSNFARKYFGSAVLADGRALICGGEYTDRSGTVLEDRDNSSEIYDPVADQWSMISNPADASGTVWGKIGDPACTLLPDGTFLMGSLENRNVAQFDPVSMMWNAKSGLYTFGDSNEDSWVLLPNNTIVSVSCDSPPATCVYDIASDKWTAGNSLPMSIISTAGGEIGPGLLRYDGNVFFLGGNQNTATYSVGAAPPWANGPVIQDEAGKNLCVKDGPAVLLPNGNILFGAAPADSSADWPTPTAYFEFDGKKFNPTASPPNNDCPTYVTRLMMLPTGDALFCREDDASFYIYHSDAVPEDAFRPVISNFQQGLVAGSVSQLSGLQFNGLSQCVAYGDDSQTATNYPLVRVTNKDSGHVRYCRTSNHTMIDGAGNVVPSMGVATGGTQITTTFQIPNDLEVGPSTLEVIANGIPSASVDIEVVLQKG
jgi:hypothetical protein